MGYVQPGDLIQEIKQVLAIQKNKNKPTIIGHSMGGMIAYAFATCHSNLIKKLILIDSPAIWHRTKHAKVNASGPLRPSKNLPEMIQRFRTLPEQPIDKNELIKHIVKSSIKKVSDGYIWSFDPQFFDTLHLDAELSSQLMNPDKITCPIDLIYGSQSKICTQQVIKQMRQINGKITMISIKDGHHALMFDHPMALIEKIQASLNA